MKRIKIVGLCLVAMFAMSALATSAAQAGEYGKCVKTAKNPTTKKYEAEYNDKNCQEVKPGQRRQVQMEPGHLSGNRRSRPRRKLLNS